MMTVPPVPCPEYLHQAQVRRTLDTGLVVINYIGCESLIARGGALGGNTRPLGDIRLVKFMPKIKGPLQRHLKGPYTSS
jgi:hypothetical protein